MEKTRIFCSYCTGVVDGMVSDGGGVDEGGGVVDEGLVGAGNTLVLHVSVVLGEYE